MSALTVLYFVLPLPIVLAIHDAEELFAIFRLGYMKFHTSEKQTEKAKWINGHLAITSLKASAAGASAEMLLIIVSSAFVLANTKFAAQIWSIMFISFLAGILTHIIISILLKKYMPGLATSVLLLPYSFIVIQCIWREYSFMELLVFSFLGLFLLIMKYWLVSWIQDRNNQSRNARY